MHSDVIRVQNYVPQDQVSGLQKGGGAIVRVPEMPGVEFRGTVSRVCPAVFDRYGLALNVACFGQPSMK
jgi:hypothetical protein